MQEIWKDVVGFEKLYKVSNLGRVKRLKRYDAMGKLLSEKIVSTKINNRGYVQLHLTRNGICYMKLLHRVVAEAFISNPQNLAQVNHKDENKLNNCIDNLEWCSNAYNRRYGTGIARMAQNHNYKEIKEIRKKSIAQKTLNEELLKEWDNIALISRELLNITYAPSIAKCCKGERASAYGYKWSYV